MLELFLQLSLKNCTFNVYVTYIHILYCTCIGYILLSYLSHIPKIAFNPTCKE